MKNIIKDSKTVTIQNEIKYFQNNWFTSKLSAISLVITAISKYEVEKLGVNVIFVLFCQKGLQMHQKRITYETGFRSIPLLGNAQLHLIFSLIFFQQIVMFPKTTYLKKTYIFRF